MNKNSPLNQRYVCPIGADGIQSEPKQTGLLKIPDLNQTTPKRGLRSSVIDTARDPILYLWCRREDSNPDLVKRHVRFTPNGPEHPWYGGIASRSKITGNAIKLRARRTEAVSLRRSSR